jgi:hypothetical protein
MARTSPRLSAVALVVIGTAAAASDPATEGVDLRPPRVEAILEQAKQQAGKIPLQALALAKLAWPGASAAADPLVQAAARAELVGFGHQGLAALRKSLRLVEPRYQADVVAALIEARYMAPAGMPADYLPALEEAVWYGSAEARRVALLELGRFDFPMAITTTIDAAHEDPEVARAALRALGRMGDTRARLFLTEVLTEGRDYYKPEAAAAIATLGGPALNILREAVRADDAATRTAAMRALLPHATFDDLSTLHEFPVLHPSDDPSLLQSIRERATSLELGLAVERDAEAASGAREDDLDAP